MVVPWPPLVPPIATVPPLVPVASTSRTEVPLPQITQPPASVSHQARDSSSRWINRIKPSIAPLGPSGMPAPLHASATSSQQCSTRNKDCRNTKCCAESGMRCFQKNQWWASCKETCTPGIDPTDAPEFQLPWDCKPLGKGSTSSPFSAKPDQVVVNIRQGSLPQNAKTGTEVTLTIGGKKVLAKIVGVKRGVHGTTASSSSTGSRANVGGSTTGWSLLSFLLTLMAFAVVGLWAWRSRAGDAAPEWLKNFPNAAPTSALERWRRGQVVTTPVRGGGGAAQQSPMQQSPGASPPGAPPAPPTSTWFFSTFDRFMNRQQETPRQQGRQNLMW